MLDDAVDAVVATPNHPPVAGGVADHGREDRARRPALPVGGDQSGDGGLPQQRRVAGEDEHVVAVVVVVEVGRRGRT